VTSITLTTGTVTVDDTTVTYVTAGLDRETHDPIVLVPGLGGSTESDFAFMLPVLARHRLVISIDFAEHAHAAGAGANSDQLARQVGAGVVAVLGIGRKFNLVGYSLGAVVSAAYAAGSTDVSNLILVAGWASPSAKLRLHTHIVRDLRQERSAAERAYLLLSAHSEAFLSGRSDDELAALASRASAPGFTESQAGLANELDITSALPRITAATLVVGCTHDNIATEQQSLTLFAGIENARYASIDSGHALLVERPAELTSLITAFLAEPDRYAPGTIIPRPRP
jgi:pimeloyl-ACP methyl ester carboxylesterase